LHILWEYYNSWIKYEPKYIQAGSEGDDILERLQRIDATLNHKIIYFEDPFGKTNYESNKDFLMILLKMNILSY
jgi:hypothetical protein